MSHIRERVIPGGITYLGSSEGAVAEIHRNAARGFVSVTMPERPHAIGVPSLWQRDFWDPIIQACVDTDTVISLHVGSSGMYPMPAKVRRDCSLAPRCSVSFRWGRALNGSGRSTRCVNHV